MKPLVIELESLVLNEGNIILQCVVTSEALLKHVPQMQMSKTQVQAVSGGERLLAELVAILCSKRAAHEVLTWLGFFTSFCTWQCL